MRRFVLAFFCVCIFAASPAGAAEICASDLALSSPQDAALTAFARRHHIAAVEAFRNIAIWLHDHDGRSLPSCYLTKSRAERLGWQRGGDLWSVKPGAAIGGDRYADREHRLPEEWRGRYIEADLDYAGGHRGTHRIIFVRGMRQSGDGSWLIFVSTDHERHFTAFVSE